VRKTSFWTEETDDWRFHDDGRVVRLGFRSITVLMIEEKQRRSRLLKTFVFDGKKTS
jgi:hypothetical protein